MRRGGGGGGGCSFRLVVMSVATGAGGERRWRRVEVR